MDFAIDGDSSPDRAAAETLRQGDVPLQNHGVAPPGRRLRDDELRRFSDDRSEGRARRPRVSGNAARPRRAPPNLPIQTAERLLEARVGKRPFQKQGAILPRPRWPMS